MEKDYLISCLKALGFAAPHALVAARRLDLSPPKKSEEAAPKVTVVCWTGCFGGWLCRPRGGGSGGPKPLKRPICWAEAASVGPQLCVILALADSPGHACAWLSHAFACFRMLSHASPHVETELTRYLWQNFVYFVAAIAFLASVAACGRSPPKALTGER